MAATKEEEKRKKEKKSPVTFSNAVPSEPDESNSNSDDGIRWSYNRVEMQPTDRRARVAESLPTPAPALETKEIKKKNEGEILNKKKFQ